MVDKHHHRRMPVPRGALSGWAFTVLLACAGALIGLVRTIA
jgi:hypothetical protein